jgi:hypothetical protein
VIANQHWTPVSLWAIISTMKESISVQGRELTPADIDFVRHLIAENPNWSRRKLSIALSRRSLAMAKREGRP